MKNLIKIAGGLFVALLFPVTSTFSQDLMPPPDPYLDSWSFYDPTNWFSDMGYAPIGFSTNIVCDTSCWSSDDGVLDCNGLILDSTNAAYLNYNVVEHNEFTNLICSAGTLWFWFSPDWDSQNLGGSGPGDWGRFSKTATNGMTKRHPLESQRRKSFTLFTCPVREERSFRLSFRTSQHPGHPHPMLSGSTPRKLYPGLSPKFSRPTELETRPLRLCRFYDWPA